MNFAPLIPDLKNKLTDGPERVGFILPDGSIVEVDNVCTEPNEGFEVTADDLIKHLDAVATWHTHPQAKSNLSTNDYYGFRNHPNWKHLIVGTDGVSMFRVEKGRVLIDQQWLDEG
ncbi:hypothetical protein JYP52_01450 [Nitratireductor aquibiodomus]|uniref:hypothetical protein n=1 Tax=Nitratireductor TaxID=245876 RepID=UPI0019D408A5|nr:MULTISPECIES: hypothetical protein [Nitratireductor]MBN7759788.1 hypothetical protein [Nitratireductor aquibiodomus]MCV0350185.1 hypothetical protein [Nitratireductor sp.]MDV2968717.1 hypothetical protein [Nitratireductor aquimarinus]